MLKKEPQIVTQLRINPINPPSEERRINCNLIESDENVHLFGRFYSRHVSTQVKH